MWQKRSGHQGGRWRGLDAETALARTPEHARNVAVKAIDGRAVGRKAPQPRPGAHNAGDAPCARLFETVDCNGDIQFLRLRIARPVRRFVMGGGPDATAFGLEVTAPGRVQHERDVSLHPGIGFGLNDAAPDRPVAARPPAKHPRHTSAPYPDPADPPLP